MDKKQIVLTEQDLHMLVEDAVKTYLVNEGVDEGWWGGVQNALHGAFGRNDQGQRNWNFNFGQTYRSGRDASSFKSYLQQVESAIEGMKQVATKTGNQEIIGDLDAVYKNLSNISQQYSQQATNVANGNQKNMWVVNPWETQRRMQTQQQNDQMQAQQKKYDRLNTRFKNYKTKYPQQPQAPVNQQATGAGVPGGTSAAAAGAQAGAAEAQATPTTTQAAPRRNRK